MEHNRKLHRCKYAEKNNTEIEKSPYLSMRIQTLRSSQLIHTFVHAFKCEFFTEFFTFLSEDLKEIFPWRISLLKFTNLNILKRVNSLICYSGK